MNIFSSGGWACSLETFWLARKQGRCFKRGIIWVSRFEKAGNWGHFIQRRPTPSMWSSSKENAFTARKVNQWFNTCTIQLLYSPCSIYSNYILLGYRVEQSVYALLRTRDMAIARYKEFSIPTQWMLDSGLVGKVY